VSLKSTSKPPQHKSQDKILAKRIVRIAARIFRLGKKTENTEHETSTNPLIINPLLQKQNPKAARLPKHPTAEENDDDDDDEEAAKEGKKDKKKEKRKRQKKLRLFTLLLLASKNQHRQMRNKRKTNRAKANPNQPNKHLQQQQPTSRKENKEKKLLVWFFLRLDPKHLLVLFVSFILP
jgi:hypothetical protein